MKKTRIFVITALGAALCSTAAIAETITSLRGDKPIEAEAPKSTSKKLMTVQGGIERNFKKQPPLVPHKVDKYRIDLRNNGCLKCHSEKTYKKEKAPKAGDSHYVTRDGKTLKTISTRRYFCNQCHVPQMEAQPLVQNVYQGPK